MPKKIQKIIFLYRNCRYRQEKIQKCFKHLISSMKERTMLANKDKLKFMVEGTYKKLKTYYYYDKTLLHIKRNIIEFEASDNFKNRLLVLAEKLYEEDMEYFKALIEKVDTVILPKTFVDKEDSKIVKGTVNKNKKISRINFSIDAPVEILILDMLWGLFIKKIYMTLYGEFTNSYAGKFKKGLFNSDNDLINGIDFKSNRCFQPYFQCYSDWRNNALNSVMEKCKQETIVMLSLDIKSFYYSVRFNFEELDVIFKEDERYKELYFYTKVVKEIYQKYTKLVRRYKKGIGNNINECILPIGLISPIIVREILLNSIDNNIVNNLQPCYYGRYVDDMLLVVNFKEYEHLNIDKIIYDLLVNNGIIRKCRSGVEYEFVQRPSLKLQSEKINCFLFERGKDNILIDVYYKQIKKNSSEANLLPDVDVLSESFNNHAYEASSGDSTGRIRNLSFLESNNYKSTLFITGLKRILKNTSYDKRKIDGYLTDIMKFYSGSQAIEFSNTWRTIFELMIMCNDKIRANEFYCTIKNEVDNLSLEYIDESEIFLAKKDVVLHKLQKTLIRKLDIAISLAIALDFNIGRLKRHKELAKKTRHSNMLNHSMVSFPLINYSTNESIDEISLINMDLANVLSDVSLRKKLFKLDSEKLRWTPRFIHLEELYYCTFYFNVGGGLSLVRNDYSKFFEYYIKYNALSNKFINPVQQKKEKNIDGFNINCKIIEFLDFSNEEDETKIGLVNTKICEKDVLETLVHPDKSVTIEKKQRLYELLNIAKKEKVKYLVFPEFYMPALWLDDINYFLKKNGITMITGLQYIACKDRVYNILCVVGNACGYHSFRNTIPFFREKNFYAPDEKLELAALGFKCEDPPVKEYYILGNSSIKYSTILCFEFTDIFSRAIMKGSLDFLCVPQLNRDTTYFSSIVEATSRDLHTFIIQANTSVYGDSRITGPYKTDYKDILKFKGGENDTVIIGKLSLKELKNFRNNYQNECNKQLQKCMKCRRINSVEQIDNICNNCRQKHEKIKGLPPNWRPDIC